MTAPTQPVTVRLADFGGTALAGVKVTARMSDVDYTADGTFVSNDPVVGTTDANGEVVLDLFPNAPAPTGLGTRGTTTLFTAAMPESRSLKVLALIPDTPCNLVNILTEENPASLTDAEAAILQAQTSAAEADASADAAAASETAAASSASSASASVSASSTSANSASSSASDAQSSASAAATSESNAASSATQAGDSETAAAASADSASSSESAAAASAAAAAASESAAGTSEANAQASQSAAATSQSAAATSETNAASSAASAASSASTATTQASLSTANRAAIDNRIYPGTYASDPTTRPDSSAIQAGDRYLSSADGLERMYVGGSWTVDAAAVTAAVAAQTAATLAAATAGVYPNSAATNVPRGLTQASVGAITAGSGGTNGTFALGWSSGNFAINPTGTFTVSGGALTAVTITGPGLYIGSSPTVPTPSFSASSGLTGAAVALTAQYLVTSGQGYWVQSASGLQLDRYKNVSGVATSDAANVQSVPAVPYFASLLASAVPDAAYAIQDSNDNAALLVDTSGGVQAISLDADTINGIPRRVLNNVARTVPTFRASIVHHLSYGQSLSLGNGGSIVTYPTLDGGFYDCVMFNANGVTSAGPRAQEGSGTAAQNHASLIAYEERPLSGGAPSGNFETPLGNAFRMIKRLLIAEDGIATTDAEYVLLGSAPGQSNNTIDQLDKRPSAGTPYQHFLDDITYGLARAQDAGKSYAVDAVYWSQGEADMSAGTSRATYTTALQNLYTDLNADVKSITGQAHDIKLILVQLTTPGDTTPTIGLAQLDAAKANANILLATTSYAVEHLASNQVHLTGTGYAHLGAYYGLCAKRATVDLKAWVNFYPKRLTRQGTILEVEFPDTGYPIALDAGLYPLQTNYGLTAVTTGLVDNPIVSVTKIGPRRIRVVLTNAAAGYLRYCFGSSWGGNIRDTCDLDANMARAKPMYRPCCAFEEAFA